MVSTKLWRSWMPALVLGAAASSLHGCGAGEDEEEAGLLTGTLLQKWTIEGTAAPKKCEANGAARMRLIIIDSAGDVDATELVPCTAFQFAYTLEIGDYTGSATFLAPNGFPVSHTLSIPKFSVRPGMTTTQTIDFPKAAVTPPSR
jgi:hypothetical protein